MGMGNRSSRRKTRSAIHILKQPPASAQVADESISIRSRKTFPHVCSITLFYTYPQRIFHNRCTTVSLEYHLLESVVLEPGSSVDAALLVQH